MDALLAENLRANYGLDLKVEDLSVSFFSNWPHASVKMKNVYLANTINPSHFGPLMKAGSIAISFNMERLLHKEFIVKFIAISDAEINLVRNEDGTKNFVFQKFPHDPAKHAGISFEVSKISINNVHFKYLNRQRGQDISLRLADINVRLKQYEDGIKANVKGKTVIEQLLFNEQNGAFLKNTRAGLSLELNYLKETGSICIYAPSNVEIEGHRYDLTSLVKLGENRKLALRIESTQLKFERVAALLTPKIRKVLSNFEVRRPIDAKVLLVANLAEKEEPVVIADVTGRKCDLSIGKSKIPYSDLDFTGKIRSLDSSGQKGDMEHASIVFTQVKGKVYDFPFTASISVVSLLHPIINIDAGLLIEARKIPFEVSKDFVLRGSATAHINYKGPTQKLNKEDFLKSPMSLQASLNFKELSYKEIDRPYVYTVNGKASLDNHDLQFDHLSVKTDIAIATVKGKAEGFVPYVFGQSRGFKATISAKTDNLDLNPLFVKNESAPAEKTVEEKEHKNDNSKIASGHFEFAVELFAKRLVVRKVEASNAYVDMYYKENSLDIKSAALNTCDGRISVKALVKDFNSVDANISVQNVDVKKLFDQFENFGQDAIVSDNLKGSLSLEAKFKTKLDEKMNLKPESMVCDAKLRLVDGHLVNYEPVQSLSNFLFRNRDFNDVTFSELNETFKLRGYEMQIDELEIGSNVLNLYVIDGLYNFKGNSNVNILIPWSNLKKRSKNYIPKNTGESAENTKGVKLNFNGPNKKMKITLGHKEQAKRF